MLARLFTLSAGSGSGSPPQAGQASTLPEPISSLDSIQEELHTRSLLFPEIQALLQGSQDQIFPLPNGSHLSASSSSTAFDYDSTLDLDARDVRILIMQDGISSVPSCLLYDSLPAPVPATTQTTTDRTSSTDAAASYNYGVQDSSRRMPTSPRKPSISNHTTRPVLIQPGSRSPSRQEIDALRAYREYADEISVYSSCVFGNSELLAYRGTSTKVHVLPPEQRTTESFMSQDGRGSLGRSSNRSSKLSQSLSSEPAAINSHRQRTCSTLPLATGSRSADRNRVLITRLFPVTLSNEDDTSVSMTPQSRYSEDNGTGGYPFPSSYNEEPISFKNKKKAHLKQKRTPMYAIALIINLPQPAPAPQANSASRSTFRGPGSYTEQDSFPSSYGSGRRIGWALVTAAMNGANSKDSGNDVSDNEASQGGGGSGDGSTTPGGVIGATTDLEERMDPITQHWDIIMRSLTQLQKVASSTILALLRASDASSSDQYPPSASTYARSTSFNLRHDSLGGSVKANKTNAKSVTLLPNALADVDRIVRQVDNEKSQIVLGLRALRVVTGQNRWGIWREEARWVSRWAAGVRGKLHQQQNTHSQTLTLQPPPRFPHPSPQQDFGQDEFLYNLLTAFLSTHTDWLQALSPANYRKRHLLLQSVKGNDDAMPARTIIVSRDKVAARRIIFLLSAFLPTNQNLANAVLVHRPSTSTFWGALSQTPPSSTIVPIVKEKSLRRKINRRGPGGGNGRPSSHSRNLSLQGQAVTGLPPATRSSSMSVAGVFAPLSHLNPQRGQHKRRPSDTGSIRTANLPFTGSDYGPRKSSAATMAITSNDTIPHFTTMQRSESFLTTRPESSASSAAVDDLKRSLRRDDSINSQNGNAFLALQQQQGHLSPGTDADPRIQGPRWGSKHLHNSSPAIATFAGLESFRLEPENAAFDSTTKAANSADDGIIDVDIAFPDFIRSFETAVSSPSSSGLLSTPGIGSGLDFFEQSCRVSVDGDLPINVAGWLQNYHSNFCLQAVPPQDNLMAQIKESLRNESLPLSCAYDTGTASQQFAANQGERWVDVSNAIIVDAAELTITRISYSRLLRPKLRQGMSTPTSGNSPSNPGATAKPATAAVQEMMQLDERFVEESILSTDSVLTKAIERVIAHGATANSMNTSLNADVSFEHLDVHGEAETTAGSNVHSTDNSVHSSRSPSVQRGRRDSSSGRRDEADPSPAVPYSSLASAGLEEVSRAECKSVILSALEEIVRDVVQSKDRNERMAGGGQSDVLATSTSTAEAPHASEKAESSVLRNAVQSWLESIDMCELSAGATHHQP
ncbi:hypothetical protein SEPCBS119000_002019 [Sporothrix epigloea]|uniref:Folliculin-interacting protein N-terminal domain-containing protein n=1 Tax=Sporothrix epigloea TaxID=1892477 RepID=A0ABP0DDV9_9PEZI